MDRAYNFWDMLIGAGYGMSVSVLVLRFMGAVPIKAVIACNILWIATLCLQIIRTWKLRRASEVSCKTLPGR